MFGRQEEQGEAKQQQEKTKIIYARVSSNHQKEDLQRQIHDLQAAYPDHELISDIGSGLNYHRKGFQRLLERVHEGAVDEVVVTHKDRLCRYGIELLEWLFTKTGTKLVVHCQDYQESDPSRELADDLLSVCNFFVARNNGRRASDNRKRRRRQQEEEGQAASRQGQEDQIVSNEGAEAGSEQLVRDGEVDL
jgi:predicted site-specific integrase-resolvase